MRRQGSATKLLTSAQNIKLIYCDCTLHLTFTSETFRRVRAYTFEFIIKVYASTAIFTRIVCAIINNCELKMQRIYKMTWRTIQDDSDLSWVKWMTYNLALIRTTIATGMKGGKRRNQDIEEMKSMIDGD